MFDFLFGGKKKLTLIRGLVEQRMRDAGFDDVESLQRIKQLSNSQLLGTPEAGIVTILETTLKMQKQGAFISQIIAGIENHRSSLGHDSAQFQEILNLAKGSTAQAADAIPRYAFYRVNIEAPGRITEDQFLNTFMRAMEALCN